MQTGVFMKSHLGTLVLCVLFLLLHLCLAAPGQPGTLREESVDAHPPSVGLPNPFGSGEEDRRWLQSFIQSSVKESDGQGGAEISSWEQEVFFLFRLYDFDRSGLLDGLEMMKLLSDYNSHHTPGAQDKEFVRRNEVVSMVDFLLQTQDLNQDGLLAPSELLSPPLPHTKDSGSEVAAEEREEAHGGLQPQENKQPQDEVKTEEDDGLIKLSDEQNGQQLPNVPAAEQEHHQRAPVHQGQPEM
ncbi:cell growth regulator with EF hand domain protein 1 isoform X1 [Hippoglossus hippoglossus]|uniref:cell growth regulator with EF hand domain protein 1 isoform X1 n=1 Tax=Hippoglossus hippoglossus TaxID=8267 RepID=UPI00148B7A3C|nr:cell growth regulator with EF hand domain protein 1 isoform X1 [Hippoglossus hippoglossus]